MKPLIVTSGEPAGIGPELCLDLARLGIPLVVLGDKFLLRERAKLLGKTVNLKDYPTNFPAPADHSAPLFVKHIPLADTSRPGQLNKSNAQYVTNMLQTAIDGCLKGEFSAMVTAPVHKAILNEAGIAFSGHTEFLADHCGIDKVVMMLMSQTMKVALVTTHLPLKEVPAAISRVNVKNSIQILHAALQEHFAIAHPRIFVAGLNPHAGENGYLGQEDQEILIPIIQTLRAQGLNIEGPMPADTMFSPQNNTRCDAYLAMYHDQGLPIIKYLSFGEASNVTLGLPFIRTSVDHGTALDLAGKGLAKDGSLCYAIECAWQMVKERLRCPPL